jgi:Uma2 family endonuclease
MALMAAIPLEDDDYYPESDGEPMAESDLHQDEMYALKSALRRHFEEVPDVFVGSNMFVYYQKGNRQAVVAPDVFMVQGVPKLLPGNRKRRKYLLWEERVVPCLVAELTSETTRDQDLDFKKSLYQRLGVAEYFLFDPEGDYLSPRLQGFRLEQGRYQPIPAEPGGSLTSLTTGLLFHVDGETLRLVDPATGAVVAREQEEIEARRRAEERIRVLEEELARLRSRRS